MGVYGLHEDDVTYNYDQLNKLYERRNSPLKGNIYAKKEEDNAKKSETSL
jgi:hypothetical protein